MVWVYIHTDTHTQYPLWYRLFIDNTLNNRVISPIPLSPIPLHIPTASYCQLYITVLVIGIGIGISAHTGYWSNPIWQYVTKMLCDLFSLFQVLMGRVIIVES